MAAGVAGRVGVTGAEMTAGVAFFGPTFIGVAFFGIAFFGFAFFDVLFDVFGLDLPCTDFRLTVRGRAALNSAVASVTRSPLKVPMRTPTPMRRVHGSSST